MTFKPIDFKDEEFWNTLTHGIGTVLSLVAFVFMLVYSIQNASFIAIFSSMVFGLGLIFLYLSSTIYHAVKEEKKKLFLKRIDHICIYFLIAGTYTPVMLVGLKGGWGWTMFGLIWGFAVFGFIFKFSKYRYNNKISLILYALMGWIAVIAIKPLYQNLSAEALTHLALGGLAYTVGIYFFANNKIKFNHLIWHLFVLAGSAFHFVAVFLYIL